jgi:hypothetical protein
MVRSSGAAPAPALARVLAPALAAVGLLLAALPLAGLPLAPLAAAEHVEINDRTFPTGACERVCIPAIVAPRFTNASYLQPGDAVVGVALGQDARAYPLEVLVWHEVVNDVMDGKPLAITYCPLCGSSAAFERTVQGQVLTFQTSGKLHRNDLVMLDDETRGLWPQLLAEAVSGPHHGQRLGMVSSVLTTWGAWKEEHPRTWLLDRPHCSDFPYAVSGCPTRSAQPARDYGASPYGDYFQSRRIGIGGEQREDERGLHPKAMVIGLERGNASKAWAVDDVRREGVVLDEVGGLPVVLTDQGGVRVFARAPGQVFVPLNATHMRDGLGQAWDLASGTTDGGGRLEEVPTLATFWFAWLDFHPTTQLWGAASVLSSTPTLGGRAGGAANVTLAFGQSMDRPSVERGLTLDPAVPFTLAWPDDRTLVVVPQGAWEPGKEYVLRITGAGSADGLPLPPYALRFRGAGSALDDLAAVPGLGPLLWVLAAGGIVGAAWWWARRPR